jgi:hypothetical protein
LLVKGVIIDPFFLNLLGKYENESGCVIDVEGIDHPLSMEDRSIKFALIPNSGRLITTIEVSLPMIISSLSYDCSC